MPGVLWSVGFNLNFLQCLSRQEVSAVLISVVFKSKIGCVIMVGSLKEYLSRSLLNSVQLHLSQGLIKVGLSGDV